MYSSGMCFSVHSAERMQSEFCRFIAYCLGCVDGFDQDEAQGERDEG
jgi:hypothetical protein